MAPIRTLRDEYRATWKDFSRKLQRLQDYMDAGAREQIDAALLEVEKARLAHNSARDRLAERLTGNSTSAHLPPSELRVRQTARMLWEFAGEPQGTAESDWIRAEQIVRDATACI